MFSATESAVIYIAPLINMSIPMIEAGAVAAQAESKKMSQYQHLDASYSFVSIAVKTTGVFGPQT